jgi:hypothetical protein
LNAKNIEETNQNKRLIARIAEIINFLSVVPLVMARISIPCGMTEGGKC